MAAMLVTLTACHTYEPPATAFAMGLAMDKPGIQDEIFVSDALIDGSREIEMGRLAIRNAQNQDLRILAQRIFDDHVRANRELEIIARQEEIPLPATVHHGETSEHNQSAAGPEFDRMFMRHIEETRLETIKKYKAASRTARSFDIRAFAARTLPSLQEQLRLARNINKVSGLSVDVNEPAGAQPSPLERDPFYEGDLDQPHQFDN